MSHTILTLCIKSSVLSQMNVFFVQKYYHGESLAVNVLVDNNTNKSVKKIKISGKCWLMVINNGESKHLSTIIIAAF